MTTPKTRREQAEEQWKDIPGYEGRYKCSDMGNVQSLISLRPMSLTKDTNGYITVGLSKDSKCKKRWVHQLVLMTFIGPRPPQMEAAHLNGKRDDNRLENLRWCSRKENHAHKKQHGTYQIGEQSSHYKLTNEQCDAIVAEYKFIHPKRSNSKELAIKYGVTQATIAKIANGQARTSHRTGGFAPKATLYQRIAALEAAVFGEKK